MRWGWIVFWVIAAIIVVHDPAGSAQTVRTWWDAGATFIANLSA
jgi:hypothetical protein